VRRRRHREPAEAPERLDQRRYADRVHRELGEALVVRGGERPLQRHLAPAPGRVDARRGEPVGAAAEAARHPRRGGSAVEHGGRGDHLHERSGRVAAGGREALEIGRRVREHAPLVGIHHDHVAQTHAPVLEHVEHQVHELRVERVLDREGAILLERRRHALEQVPRRARGKRIGARDREQERRARERQPLQQERRHLGQRGSNGCGIG
jgi:hypothetical protein